MLFTFSFSFFIIDIECSFTCSEIQIQVDNKMVLDGKLFGTIKTFDSMWTLEDCGLFFSLLLSLTTFFIFPIKIDKGKNLEIQLAKAEEHQLWLSVVKGKGSFLFDLSFSYLIVLFFQIPSIRFFKRRLKRR